MTLEDLGSRVYVSGLRDLELKFLGFRDLGVRFQGLRLRDVGVTIGLGLRDLQGPGLGFTVLGFRGWV